MAEKVAVESSRNDLVPFLALSKRIQHYTGRHDFKLFRPIQGIASRMSTVRIKEVAKLARVSTATVSHVINKTRFVSDDTKRKVLYAIERVGYTPNIHARNLASGRSRTLGLIISDITNPFFPDLVKSRRRALRVWYGRGLQCAQMPQGWSRRALASSVRRRTIARLCRPRRL